MSTMMLPELHLADWRPTKDTLHLYAQIVGKIRLATTAPRNHWWNVPLYVDVRGPHDPAPASSRHDVRDHDRLPRSRPCRADRRRPHQVVRARRRVARRGLRRPPPRDARRARHRRRDQGAAVRRPDDDAVSPGRRARVVGSRRDRALRPDPRLVGLGVRGVQRLVQRQDEPGAPLLARPRPRGHALLGPARRRRSTPIRSPRRRTRTRSSRSASGPATTPSATPPTTPTPRPSPRDCASSRFRRASWIEYGSGSLAVLPYEAVRSARDPRTTLLAFCQSAYEAGARLAGWDTAHFESSWCPTPAQLNHLHATAAAEFGRPSASS